MLEIASSDFGIHETARLSNLAASPSETDYTPAVSLCPEFSILFGQLPHKKVHKEPKSHLLAGPCTVTSSFVLSIRLSTEPNNPFPAERVPTSMLSPVISQARPMTIWCLYVIALVMIFIAASVALFYMPGQGQSLQEHGVPAVNGH
jgi:hypothetical protein